MSTTHVQRTYARLPKWSGSHPIKPKPQASEPDPEAFTASRNTETETDFQSGTALDLVKQRSAPAFFIVGPDNRVLYANEQVLNIFKDSNNIPAEVQTLCNRIRARAGDAPFDSSGADCEILKGPGEHYYSYRGFLVKGQENSPWHVMVLVEKVVERHPINLKKAQTQFGLSDREMEVVTLLAQGLCNKEIGSKLFVSEHTVKGHLKSITRKLGAESRGNIIAILK